MNFIIIHILVFHCNRQLHYDMIPEHYDLDGQLKVIAKHHHRQRWMSPCCDDCYPGSIVIGSTVFADMVKSLSELVPLFCKNTRIAAMTFGTHIYHEFCFNCFKEMMYSETN